MVDRYLNLITPFHRGKPKFAATIRAIVDPVVSQTAFIKRLPLDFDIDRAIGVQLDVVGEWVGRSRFIRTPIPNAWFSFEFPLRGFDQGVWRQPFDSDSGITRLDDETFRTLLRAKIAANNWDGTLAAAKAALEIIFPTNEMTGSTTTIVTDDQDVVVTSGGDILVTVEVGETRIIITDNQDMTVTFGVAGVIPSTLLIALLSDGYLPLKPEGVRANYLITTVSGPLFGFDVQNSLIAGFDTGAWGATPSYFTS